LTTIAGRGLILLSVELIPDFGRSSSRATTTEGNREVPEDVGRSPSGSPQRGRREGLSQGPDSRLVQRAVRRAKEGDRDALHFLYVRYAQDLNRYVNSFVRDHHEADDIVQDVFAKLIAGIGKYEQRDVPFTAWIMRVARNAALDHMRARRATPTEDIRVADDDTAAHSHANVERGRDLRQALEGLPDDQREVLVLRHVVGLSPVEIADTLGKSESSIHGLHHRGRRQLKSSLRQLGAAPTIAVSRPDR
jgi:RNA polymerase sigma-70 factor (ECF subfamily)